MQFLDVKTDYAFKKVFGSKESKDILISFLNAIIYDDSEVKIKDVTILDPYNIPMIKGVKDTYVDVKAELDNNTKVIIEMQVLNVEAFEKRVLYNAAKNYSMQLQKGDPYSLLNPIIGLTITDFVMFPEFEKYESRFQLMEKDEFIKYNGDIEIIFIEFHKFKKELVELKDIKEKWIYFIKNAGKLDFIPKNIDKEIEKAFEIVNTACMSEEELEAQFKRKDFIWLQKGSIEFAKKKGLEEGFQEGIQKGIEKGIKEGELKAKQEMVKNLLKAGVDINIIMDTTKLSKEEILKLK